MEHIGNLFNLIVEGMQSPFSIYGYEISFWQIFIFSIVASIICSLIGGFFR